MVFAKKVNDSVMKDPVKIVNKFNKFLLALETTWQKIFYL